MKRVFFAFLIGSLVAFFANNAAMANTDHVALIRECHDMCTKNLASFEQKGGKYADPARLNLMRDCAKICELNADFLSRKSAYADDTGKLCAQICNDCAKKCEELKDSSLKDCIALCRECATACSHHAK
jgi:hypothetical protein